MTARQALNQVLYIHDCISFSWGHCELGTVVKPIFQMKKLRLFKETVSQLLLPSLTSAGSSRHFLPHDSSLWVYTAALISSCRNTCLSTGPRAYQAQKPCLSPTVSLMPRGHLSTHLLREQMVELEIQMHMYVSPTTPCTHFRFRWSYVCG